MGSAPRPTVIAVTHIKADHDSREILEMSDTFLYVYRLYVVKYVQGLWDSLSSMVPDDANIMVFPPVASLALLTYDTILTFDQEVEYIWSRKLNAPQILYFISRYSPYIDTILDVYDYVAKNPDPRVCRTTYGISSVFNAMGTALSEIILIMRTYALYDRSTKFLYILGTIWIVAVSVVLWAVSEFVKSTVFEPQPNAAIPGCNLASASSVVFICFAVLLVVESIIVGCTIWKGITLIRRAKTSNLLRIIYYLAIFPFTVGNVIILLTAPTELLDLFDTLTRVLHAMLCCRIILHLRAAGHTSAYSIDVTTYASGEIRCRHPESEGTKQLGETLLPGGGVVLDEGRGPPAEIELVDVTSIR
ncbi:hypothetical protein EVG20_g3023 [Dentipellis fragilis]|uniref:DUF6533 domain-containing protein n=1 Tax=Dentipellis fragilis TaxID=205917 RepID=A0A4Y9Z4F1_9AGAM|nr:hypothetical protein EVG20_g3023 [Dentipellis fragilis]